MTRLQIIRVYALSVSPIHEHNVWFRRNATGW